MIRVVIGKSGLLTSFDPIRPKFLDICCQKIATSKKFTRSSVTRMEHKLWHITLVTDQMGSKSQLGRIDHIFREKSFLEIDQSGHLKQLK